MQATCNLALKEWAVVTAAIATGQQTILLRKGGIAEAGDRFRPEHPEFWLLPTRFHQDPGSIRHGAQSLWTHAMARQAEPSKFSIELFATVQEVFEIRDLRALEAVSHEHILSAETVAQRFNYRDPGLFLLLIRAYRVSHAFDVADSPYLAGCKSWVELPEPLPTAGITPILSDEDFAQRWQTIAEALKS